VIERSLFARYLYRGRLLSKKAPSTAPGETNFFWEIVIVRRAPQNRGGSFSDVKKMRRRVFTLIF